MKEYKNCKIFAETVEATAMEQIKKLADFPAYENNKIRIMPDTHAGAGCTIGTTMTITDKITPNLVGVDIGCGMVVCPLLERVEDFSAFDNAVRKYIPSGFAIHETPAEHTEDWVDKLGELKCASAIDIDYMVRSIGSLGGGNHFIEIDENEQGHQYLVIHSGSRNLGVKVAKYYQDLTIKGNKKTDIQELINKLRAEGRESEIQSAISNHKTSEIPKELAFVEGWLFDDYLHDMRIAQAYAYTNRIAMVNRLVIYAGLSVSTKDVFTTIHNYIDLDNMILRKGAVSAQKGERLIIPINMRDGSLICIGKGNEDWNYSAPHGAGRLMSRKAAKEKLSMEDYKQSMSGIFTTSVDESTKDEAPMAYKPMDEIIRCIEPTCEIERIIKPVYNFKAQGE